MKVPKASHVTCYLDFFPAKSILELALKYINVANRFFLQQFFKNFKSNKEFRGIVKQQNIASASLILLWCCKIKQNIFWLIFFWQFEFVICTDTYLQVQLCKCWNYKLCRKIWWQHSIHITFFYKQHIYKQRQGETGKKLTL